MSNQSQRRSTRPAAASVEPASDFVPVPVRPRHDGWTPARQVVFVRALAACANIEEACAAVGMSPRSFYDLRSRPDAGSFRQAVECALDAGVHRIADAMLGRALHGEVTPVFYRGEQVGERRRFDNRLGMFILRARAPERYGKWREGLQFHRDHPDGANLLLDRAINNLTQDAVADAAGRPRPVRAPLKTIRRMDDPGEIAEEEARLTQQQYELERQEEARRDADFERYLDTLGRQVDHPGAKPDSSQT